MKKITTHILLAMITCCFFGCTLEDTEISKIAPDRQNAVYCPAKTYTEDADVERTLTYLQIPSDDIGDDPANCTKENCNSKSDCCGLPKAEAELYYLAFKYSICPQNMRCMTDKNKDHYCEIKETECTGDYVKCNNDCYNIMTDNMNCGECNSPCETRDIPNSKTVACIEGVCTAIYCFDGYHVNNQTNECVPDNASSCGGTDCTKAPGWIDGYCQNDKCVAKECSIGYHIYNQTDEENNYYACEKDAVERCGESYIKCESGEGIENIECQDGDCTITECSTGYHISENNQCAPNTARECGSYNKDCYSDPTWGNGDNIADVQDGFCDETLNCFANSCAEGYHPYNQFENTTFIPCQKDTPDNCGPLGLACEDPKPLCLKGECVEACSEGLELCGTECANLTSDIKHCTSCDNPCSIGNSMKTTCDNGCHYTCDNGYYDCDGNKENGCEVNLANLHWASCNTCDNDYADCDSNPANGCESKLSQKHWTSCNICINDNGRYKFADCDKKSDNGCEVDLNQRHWTSCNVCEPGYANCDKNDDNGCETNLASKNWTACNACKPGFGECDGNASNGCETNLANKKWSSCGTCLPGYANCDTTDNNCEIELAKYGLTKCKTCMEEYTKCGNHPENSKISLCLKSKGKGWNTVTFSSKNCKKACNNQDDEDYYFNGSDLFSTICKPKQFCKLTYDSYNDAYDAECTNK